MKPLHKEKEFNKLWKKRYELARKLQKIKYSSKEYKRKYKQLEEITKEIEKSTIKFKSWFVFFIFSIYFGLLEGLPFWAIKNSTKYFLEAAKIFFTLKPYGIGFMWNKIGKDKYIIDSFVYFLRRPKE